MNFEHCEKIELTEAGQKALVDALNNPPEVSEKLKQAYVKHIAKRNTCGDVKEMEK